MPENLQYRVLLENIPVIAFIASTKPDAPTEYISPQVETILGYPVEMFLEDTSFWKKILHPQDAKQVLNESARIRQAGLTFRMNYRLIAKSGQVVWVRDETRLIRDEEGKPAYWLGTWTDITSIKSDETNLYQREAILGAVAFAAEQFLKTSDWRANIDIVLEQLGKSIEASHAYLFENGTAKDGSPVTRIRYEWGAEDAPSDLDNVSYQEVPLLEKGFENWYDTLRCGVLYEIAPGANTPEEIANFEERGIKALLDVPIFVNGAWWGIIGFDDLKTVRQWSEAEKSALLAAANIISAAIEGQLADAAHQETVRIYRQAIEAAGAVPYYQDYASRSYPFMSEGIRSLTGYGPEEMFPTKWDEITLTSTPGGENTGLSHQAAVERARTGITPVWKCDFKIRTKDGQVRWVSDASIELRDPSGQSLGSIGILQDVTERKRTEEILRENEEKYRLLIENQTDLVVKVDIEGRFLYVSPSYCKLFGKTEAELLGQNYMPLVHKDDQLSTAKAVEKLNQPPYTCYIEQRALTSTGWRWLAWSDSVVFDENHEMLSIIGVGRDITERKRTEQVQAALYHVADAAQTTEDIDVFFKMVHQIVGELMPADNFYIVLYDPENDLLHVPYRADEFPDDQIPYRPGKGLSAYVMRTGQPTLITPEVFSELERLGEVEIIKERMIDWAGVPLRTREGIIGVMAVQTYHPDQRLSEHHRDILAFISTQVATAIQRQQSLDEIKRLNAELEQRVKERTSQLEVANAEIQSFSYSVSHDLRAPLRAVRGYTQILMQEHGRNLPSGAFELLQVISDSAQEMSELIDGLLIISRLSRAELQHQTVNLSAIVAQIASSYQESNPGRVTDVQIAPNLFASADERLIRNVLENLFGNAWKYTSKTPTAQITFGVEKINGQDAFFFRDNGVGFDMKYSDKLFGAFQRLHSAGEFPGHGIGLASVKRIIQRHGGKIWADSVIGQGATFYFTLP